MKPTTPKGLIEWIYQVSRGKDTDGVSNRRIRQWQEFLSGWTQTSCSPPSDFQSAGVTGRPHHGQLLNSFCVVNYTLFFQTSIWLVPEMKIQFNTRKSIYWVHHVSRLKKKNSIVSIDKEKGASHNWILLIKITTDRRQLPQFDKRLAWKTSQLTTCLIVKDYCKCFPPDIKTKVGLLVSYFHFIFT